MAKRRADRPVLESVKIRSDVMDSARVVAVLTGESIADMLSDILRPVLARREREEVARKAKDLGTKP
jgi:hypothetical protein